MEHMQAQTFRLPTVDYVESGSGPAVVLVHSSLGGARQWRSLTETLGPRFHVRAVNLFGYGGTPPWLLTAPPSLDDYADLVAEAIPHRARDVTVVGHSFGGAVAMRVAQRHRDRVGGLVLIEPSLFTLLKATERTAAFAEIQGIARETLRAIGNDDPERAARRFVDYWCGDGSWAGMADRQRDAVLAGVAQLSCEWPSVLEAQADLAELQRTLPTNTMLISFSETVRPARELVEVLAAAFPQWLVVTIAEAGHMGPLTHPGLVNAVIREFLAEAQAAEAA